jgi:hypothetical protein
MRAARERKEQKKVIQYCKRVETTEGMVTPLSLEAHERARRTPQKDRRQVSEHAEPDDIEAKQTIRRRTVIE